MCGRLTLFSQPKDVADLVGLPELPPLKPRFNIAPTQQVLAVRTKQGAGREAAWLRWGLVPSWAADLSIGYKLLNARSETASSKPSFRSAFGSRRCLVPTSGFYEWSGKVGKKKPLLFGMPDDRVFALAGLWERWEGDGEVVESCTLLTTQANELLASYHDRMPVIVAQEDFGR
jgi:putative SOS response-associated peptidase YedK